jgi:hypothetical protein
MGEKSCHVVTGLGLGISEKGGDGEQKNRHPKRPHDDPMGHHRHEWREASPRAYRKEVVPGGS